MLRAAFGDGADHGAHINYFRMKLQGLAHLQPGHDAELVHQGEHAGRCEAEGSHLRSQPGLVRHLPAQQNRAGQNRIEVKVLTCRNPTRW